MNTPLNKRNHLLATQIVKALQSRKFDAYYVENSADAVQKALSLIPQDHVVSWGGSATLEQTGLLDAVKKRNKVIDRDLAPNREEKTALMRQALLADTFLTSANAISEDGQIVNI
ncbi:MAG: lactate utilization protein, partial [Bacteroidales bacterium]|nr:lactate utilization protein [Bacteroidales bacterium]